MTLRNAALALLLILLSACKPAMTIEDFADDEKEAKANRYLEQLLEGDFVPIKEALEPSLREQVSDQTLAQMKAALDSQRLLEKRLVGYRSHTQNNEPTRYNLTYQYEYDDKWIIVNLAFRTLSNGSDEIFGMNVYSPMAQSLQEANAFSLNGKRPVHFVFLAACLAVPGFILYTLQACIRTKLVRRKWLWILFILVGFVQFSLNWSTGQVGFRLFSVQLLGAGAFTASMYSPWFISFSLPVGAFMFWTKRAEIRANPAEPNSPPEPDERAPS